MNRRMLGITVLGDYIVSEGPQIVLENLLRIGATAVAINPTVTCQGDRSTGKFQPPSDAGHSPRKFDRPLFGKHALWVRSAPSFHPRSELYPESPYRPRQTNELTDELGGLIGQFIDACLGEGIDVYLQVGAAEPSGLRDEDRPRLPDGSLPSGRIADVGSLASPAIRAYNRAYANDLAAAYPKVTGFRIDWPEYPCYTPDEIFQDFSPHAEKFANTAGFDFTAIRDCVLAFLERINGHLSNDDLAAPATLLEEFPDLRTWLNLKAALSRDLISGWKAVVDSLAGGPKKLSLHSFPPPFSSLTGFDYAAAAKMCDSISPKFYTMHWCLVVHGWGGWLLERNPSLDEPSLTSALLKALNLVDEIPPRPTLADFAYPQPDQSHPVGAQAQLAKIEEVLAAVAGRVPVYPLVHGYGPPQDFACRLRSVLKEPIAGVWINRYGYLSDEKLNSIANTLAEYPLLHPDR